MIDLLLRNATVIDGTGSDGFPADVAVEGGRIARVGRIEGVEATRTIEAAGRIITPGFIDVHTHSDGPLLRQANFAAKTSQGFTTELLMLDGIAYAPVSAENWREWFVYLRALDGLRLDDYRGWTTIEDYMRCVDGATAQNALPLVAYGNVRALVLGFGPGPIDDYQSMLVSGEVARGMRAGAAGLSTGLDYLAQWHATTDELVDACRAIAPFSGIYVTHVRYKRGLRRALDEAVDIARRADVPLHLSHLKAVGDMSADDLFEFLGKCEREVDVSFDLYPYQSGSTMLHFMLPYEVWCDGPLATLPKLADPQVRRRVAEGLQRHRVQLDRIRIAWVTTADNKIHQGRTVAQYVADTGRSPADALCDLLIEERLAVLAVFVEGDDEAAFPLLEHDRFMLGSDGIFFAESAAHPRVCGSATRLLQRAVQGRTRRSLGGIIHRMTQFPAERFGLTERGVVRAGYWADLVVWNPEQVADRATYENPNRMSAGIDFVLVNGTPVVDNGAVIEFQNGGAPGRRLWFRA